MEPGEWANPGTKLLSVANLDRIFAYIYVPQEIMSKLSVGQKLDGFIPELDEHFPGSIQPINSEAEFTLKTCKHVQRELAWFTESKSSLTTPRKN